MNRRDFIATAATTSAVLAFAGCNEGNRQAIDYSKHPKKDDHEKKKVYHNKNK